MVSLHVNLHSKFKGLLILVLIILNLSVTSTSFDYRVQACDYFFEANLEENDVEKRFDGYNLFAIEKRDSNTWKIVNRTLLITDMDGNIYFERQLATSSVFVDYPAEFINSTTILYGDDNGANLWNIETNVTQELNVDGHHDYEKNHVRNTYFSVFGYSITIGDNKYIYDFIQENTEEGVRIWSISTRDFLNENQWCPYEDMIGDLRDNSHANTLFYDEEDDSLYVNVRNVNTFYKIDIPTKEVKWGLGEYGNFTNYDINGQQQDVLFYHAHAVEKIDDNTFVLFDNDYHNQTNADNKQSRLLEIVIDEDKMQANVTWEWNSPIEYYSDVWGDCDVLPNNNRLGVFGTHRHPNTGLGARLVEVTYDGNIAWEMTFPEQDSYTFGVYKIERIHFSPIVSEPVFIDEGGGSGYLEWSVWYNFRAKTEFIGNYFISVDGDTVEEELITFPKYWQSEKIRYYTDYDSIQNHDIVLVVEDEAGHKSNESDRYSPIGFISISLINEMHSESVYIISFSFILVTLILNAQKIKRKRKQKKL